jgi:CheY-like chemotaxis protein
VIAEPNQLELAVLNLFINARDAMPEGGRLVIATRDMAVIDHPDLEAGDYVRLTVQDCGTGMGPDVLRRVFDPFFTTKEKGKGTGLGLSQVFGFARRVGGAVRIESTPGQGTTVSLYLRRTLAGPAAIDAQGAGVALPCPNGPVLVVDDDPSVREVLVSWLNEMGIQTLEAVDGASGLILAHQTAPAAMLVDFAMPGMNGARLAEHVRAAIPNLPVVFVTGYADTDAILAAVGDTAPILRKPFKPADLAAALARALNPL